MRGRLWRTSNPHLPESLRESLVRDLMKARRDVAAAKRENDAVLEKDARERVHAAKVALGERGPVWWDQRAPAYSRHLFKTTPYAA